MHKVKAFNLKVLQWLALFPHSKKVVNLTPSSKRFFKCSDCIKMTTQQPADAASGWCRRTMRLEIHSLKSWGRWFYSEVEEKNICFNISQMALLWAAL